MCIIGLIVAHVTFLYSRSDPIPFRSKQMIHCHSSDSDFLLIIFVGWSAYVMQTVLHRVAGALRVIQKQMHDLAFRKNSMNEYISLIFTVN